MRPIIFALLFVITAGGIIAAERNIILFITDDQSPDAGCYGNAAIKMPNLAALAADGTLFTHAFATALVSAFAPASSSSFPTSQFPSPSHT